ncbi:rod-determining factor RdfA [Natronomonas sp.]|uniref:rod-determining factor RdfA n=1 Tax=Natronomonas sp. TaxID=2184060 RepID=UPI00261D8535|nr:rod-determining factor RdfA [Natronomonas sp.]
MTSADDSGKAVSADETNSAKPSSKVARLIGEYDLGPSVGDRLEALWTADGERRESLRSLADRFNKRLLSTAIADAGTTVLDGEVDNLYRLLTDEDATGGQRAAARNRLRQEGIDVDGLETDFVTYQAIRSYLTQYRGAEYEKPSDTARVESTRETVQQLTARLRSVADDGLRRLRKTSALSLGEFRILVDVSVLCEDCGSQYEITTLLSEGGCDCDRE